MSVIRRKAFTLVELLVVIGIIALLVSILLPSLNAAKEAAKTIKCSANLHAVGEFIAIYVSENKQTFPASYVYDGMSLTQPNPYGDAQAGGQSPTAAVHGYLHWSAVLGKYKAGDTSTWKGLGVNGQVANDQFFYCPSIPNGGLPKTNTQFPDPGQTVDTAGVEDIQATRMPYTLNEAVCCRNKFRIGFNDSTTTTTYHYVRAGQVTHSADTILGTEFCYDFSVISDKGRSGGGIKVKSHRPVSGFKVAIGGTGPGNVNLETVPAGGQYYRCTVDDLMPNVIANWDRDGGGSTSKTRLDWVGHNHGTGAYDKKKTNFLYCDGHCETKNIRDTLLPKFEWGDRMFSLDPTARVSEATTAGTAAPGN